MKEYQIPYGDRELTFHLPDGVPAKFARLPQPQPCSNPMQEIENALNNPIGCGTLESFVMPRLLGMHLEGPYFSMEMRGAQGPQFITTPTQEHWKHIWSLARGNILRWTVAPELDGAIDLIRNITLQGCHASIGHTNAYYEDVLAAYEAGCHTATHLYSGMSTIRRELGARRIGAIETALLLDDMMVELISDGIHLPTELLQLVLKTKGVEHIILVTDAMRAAGTQAERSVLGSLKDGQEVLVEDGVAKLLDRSAYAGSVATADRQVRVMHKNAGVGIVDAVRMMSYNAAKAVGMQNEIGSLSLHRKADIILFDEDIQVSRVIVGGEILV